MGKAEQSCAQAQSKSQHRAERFCGGRKSLLHIHCAVIEVCTMNGKMCVRGAGRRGRRPLQVRWQDFSVAESCCYRGLVPSTGERCSPLQICCHKFVFDLFYSIFKLRSGRDIGYYVLGLCILKISQCTPTS